MQKTLIALPSSPKSIIVKAGNQFNGYVSNFNDNQKMKNFAFILKKVSSFSKSMSLVFTFNLKRELDSGSFSVLGTKLFHIAGSRIDIRNLLLRGLVFGLL